MQLNNVKMALLPIIRSTVVGELLLKFVVRILSSSIVNNIRDLMHAALPPLKPRQTPFGFLFSGTRSNHHVAMQNGTFEADEVGFLLRNIDLYDVFVDIGSNVGYFACIARVYGKIVIAVEPHKRNSEILLGNIAANEGAPVEVYQVALADKVDVLTLYGWSTTGASLIPKWAGSAKHKHGRVAVNTLDNLLEGRFNGLRLLIKIDVEGFESSVIRGSASTLSREIKPIWMIELTSDQYHPNGFNPTFYDVFLEFMDAGYQCFVLAGDKLELVNPTDREQLRVLQENGLINYLFADQQLQ